MARGPGNSLNSGESVPTWARELAIQMAHNQTELKKLMADKFDQLKLAIAGMIKEATDDITASVAAIGAALANNDTSQINDLTTQITDATTALHKTFAEKTGVDPANAAPANPAPAA